MAPTGERVHRIVPAALLTGVILGCSGTAVSTEPAPAEQPEQPEPRRRGRSIPDAGDVQRPGKGTTDSRTKIIDLEFEGKARKYRVVPPDHASGPVPVIFMFHGGGSGNTGRKAEFVFSGERGKNELLVYPDGIEGRWRLRGMGGDQPDIDPLVDVRFVDAIIDDLDKRFDIDRSRVYAAGFSNGGMLVWELACSNPEPFAGFAAVAASMTTRTLENCHPKVTRPFLYIHGTEDPRFDGGRTATEIVEGGVMLSGHAATTRAAAKQIYGCEGISEVGVLDDCSTDGYRVHRHRLTGCKGGEDRFIYLEVEGLRHQWPRPKHGGCIDVDAASRALQLWGLDL
jgi:poly(3-hydroxybutyrate) depolymerase